MKRVLIFKNDAIGDLLHLSGCIKTIHENFKDCKITLVCSQYNYKVAKNYLFIDRYIILNHKSFFLTLLNNYKDLLLDKYKHVFILDAKKSSFRTSFFVRTENRSSLCFWKKKNILGFKFNLYRPSKILLKLFVKNYIICDEDYNNTQIRYQKLYFKLLENLNFKIISKKNFYVLSKNFSSDFSDFHSTYIKNKYVLFHLDEKWDMYNERDCSNALKLIKKLSTKSPVLITTGIKKFRFLSKLEKLFCLFDFINNKINKINHFDNHKVLLVKNIPFDLLAHFIANSSKIISSHAGALINIASVFNIKSIDIIKEKKFNELGRWIPGVSDYKRYSFEEIENHIDDI